MTSIFPPTKIGYPYVIEQRQRYDGLRLVSFFESKDRYDKNMLTISYTRCMPDKSLLSVTFDLHESLYVGNDERYDDNVLREADSELRAFVDQMNTTPIKPIEYEIEGFKVLVRSTSDSFIRNQYVVNARKMFGSDRKMYLLDNIEIDMPFTDAMRFIKDALKKIPTNAQINP